MSGDASQDSESTKPEDSPDTAAVSKKSAFTDEHDLDELPEEEPLTPEMVEEEAVCFPCKGHAHLCRPELACIHGRGGR